MSTIEVAVAGRGIHVKQGYEKPSSGDVNTCAVSLAIDSGGVWDDLPHKRVTFSTRTASVTVDYAPTITIPHEVLASPGALYLTLTGYDADGIEVARTHRMTYPIEVARAGADEGADPSPATLDVVSRIDALAADLEEKRDTDYWRGAPGAPGEPGEPGYSPTANVTKVGGTATITVTDKNGTTTATVSDGAPGSDAESTDVRINGNSITANGVADIPIANGDTAGVILTDDISGGYSTGLITAENRLWLRNADNSKIANRNIRVPILANNMDYAVKAAMCDGKGAAWTEEEKLDARERIGLGGDFELIESFTMTQEAQFSRNVTPSGKNYAFKKLFVIAYNEVTSIPAWKTIRPSLDGSNESIVTIDGLAMPTHMYTLSASVKEYNAIYFDVSRGIFDMSVESFNNEAYSSKYPTRKTIPKKFNAVTGFTVDSGGFPTGTKINIYGVWS